MVNVPRLYGLKESILNGKVTLIQGEEKFEREIIEDALKKANYVQSHAAEMLGVSRRILKYKMDKFGISQENEKSSSE
jgi:transcriptional regulator with GAF, ATPase, and Fis domain